MSNTKMDELSGVLTLRSLIQKGDVCFSIPSYQRGYRWKQQNIQALIDDLLDFEDNDELPLYCLQPIVVQTTAIRVGDDQRLAYRIVDGQQRLTTITILLMQLGVDVPWNMYYETYGNQNGTEEGKWLKDLLKDPDNDRGVNGYFRRQARKCIDEEITSDQVKQKLKHALGLCEEGKDVAFIGYHLREHSEECGHAASAGKNKDEAHSVFDNLNDGKVPLTSAELIRALYEVNANAISPADKIEIAKEWELIERDLHDESLWRIFIHGDTVPYTRIEELFAVVAETSKLDRKIDPLAVYHDIERRVVFENGKDGKKKNLEGRANKLKEIWKQVVELHWWMRSCFIDVELANYLGWLALFQEIQLKTLYSNYKWGQISLKDDSLEIDSEAKSKQPTKFDLRLGRFECFKRNIMAYIASIIQNDYPGLGSSMGVDSVCYVDGDFENALRLRKLFVLLNVCACNSLQERFRFDLYVKEEAKGRAKGQGWHIDHIHLHSEAQGVTASGHDVNRAWNLALVDSAINQGEEFKKQGDQSFASKREKIQGLMKSVCLHYNDGLSHEQCGQARYCDHNKERPHYIPPLSQRVYMKFYSDTNASKQNTWEYEHDGKPYEKALTDYITVFISQAKEEMLTKGALK